MLILGSDFNLFLDSVLEAEKGSLALKKYLPKLIDIKGMLMQI